MSILLFNMAARRLQDLDKSTGFNHDRRHAEVAALLKLWPSERVGATIYVARLRRRTPTGLAAPCQACESFLRTSGVRGVFYSTSQGWEFRRL